MSLTTANFLEKVVFVTWLINLDTSYFDNWILAGDFNQYRSMEDRSKIRGNFGGNADV